MQHEYLGRGYEHTIATFASLERPHRYEWGATLDLMPVNGLYFCDPTKSWWHYCVDQVLEVLEKYRPRLLVGVSAGGYGALLFGQLTGIPARAFSPQTTLERVEWDGRYEQHLPQVRSETKHPELLALSVAGEQHHLYYGEEHREDARHAERLAVRKFPLPTDSHRITKDVNLKAALAW